MKRLIRLTEGDLHRIVKESIQRVLTEMPTGKKIPFKDDKRNVGLKFRTRIRNPKFGLCKSDQRQLGMMYAEAFENENLAERISQYALEKQAEYARMNCNGDPNLREKLEDEMLRAFDQGELEYHNQDIWKDDDPKFSYWNNPNQF